MQVTSGSRDYLPVGSARVRFADPLPFPFEYVLGSRTSGPVSSIASGCQGNRALVSSSHCRPRREPVAITKSLILK